MKFGAAFHVITAPDLDMRSFSYTSRQASSICAQHGLKLSSSQLEYKRLSLATFEQVVKRRLGINVQYHSRDIARGESSETAYRKGVICQVPRKICEYTVRLGACHLPN